MSKDDLFYTRTMAKVYIDQGNLLKAAEIYRYLLESEPERRDLKDELSEIEKKLNEKSPDDLTKLFNRWMDLLLKYHNVQKLLRFKNYLSGLKEWVTAAAWIIFKPHELAEDRKERTGNYLISKDCINDRMVVKGKIYEKHHQQKKYRFWECPEASQHIKALSF